MLLNLMLFHPEYFLTIIKAFFQEKYTFLHFVMVIADMKFS